MNTNKFKGEYVVKKGEWVEAKPLPQGVFWAAMGSMVLMIGILIMGFTSSIPVKALDYDNAVNAAITAQVACNKATLHNKHSGHASVACEEAVRFSKQADKLHSLYLQGRILHADEVTAMNYKTLQTLKSRG